MPSKPRFGKGQLSSRRSDRAEATPIRFQIPTAEVARKLDVTVEELSDALKAGDVVVEYKIIDGGFRSSFTYEGRTAELEYKPILKH